MNRLTAILAALLLTAWNTASFAQPAFSAGVVPSADGVEIHYDVRGEGSPALILVHGWTNSRGIWGQHPQTLASTHRVVTIDLAGHGASGANRENWTIDAFGEDVAAVANHLQLDQIVLLGFSMGGAVVFEAAELLGDRVAGIVLVDAFHDPSDAAQQPDLSAMETMFRERWSDPAFIRAFGFTPETPDSVVQFAMSMHPPAPHEHWFDVMRAMWDWRDEQFEPTVRAFYGPVASINTTRRPTNVEAMREYFPGYLLETIDGVGHAGILLQRVEEFDQKLRRILSAFEAQSGNELD